MTSDFGQLQRDFETLEGRWREPLAKHTPRRSEVGAELVAQWRPRLEAMREEAAALRTSGRWVRGPDDLLSAVGRQRDELTHSAALAWLLDPIGGHGLGSAMLERLLQHLDVSRVDSTDLAFATVRREVVHPEGRADIVVDMPGLRVVIENKIDAMEQPNQCWRMIQAFDTDVCEFIFLTLRGGTPGSAGPSVDRWHELTYRQIAAWLLELLGELDATQHLSARSYLTTLQRITR